MPELAKLPFTSPKVGTEGDFGMERMMEAMFLEGIDEKQKERLWKRRLIFGTLHYEKINHKPVRFTSAART